MALNIKNAEVEHLAAEIAVMTKTSKTEAIRLALIERRDRLEALAPETDREDRLRRFLEFRVWPTLPKGASRRWTKRQEAAALGYGDSGEPV